MFRLFTIIITLLTVAQAMAQSDLPILNPSESKADTMPGYMRPAPDSLLRPSTPEAAIEAEKLASIRHTLSMQSIFPLADRSFSGKGYALPGKVIFPLWSNGALVASGSKTEMPGFMAIDNGRLSLVQQFGNLTLTAYGEAAHYGYFRGMATSWGFGGSASYKFSERLSLTLFGSYSTSVAMPNPAMAGYVGVPNFGGYFNYRFSDHWGVKLGAQTYRSMVTNNWENQPMAIPYYRFDNGQEIGIDVGGILYNIIRNNSHKHMGPRNPVIGPPVGGPPPVAPRPDKH